MPSKATVNLVGHAGRDGELKYSQSGMALYSFSVATSEYQGRDREPATTWWEVTVFGKFAETLNNGDYPVRKGDLVVLDGSVYLDKWQGQDGAERQTLKVKANNVMSLGKRNDDGGAPDHSSAGDSIPF